MSKVFYPQKSIFIDASFPHPPNTQYKISLGAEDWDGVFVNVTKVQMVYNGIISGRRSPSYPIGTDDYERVDEVLKAFSNECVIKTSESLTFTDNEELLISLMKNLEQNYIFITDLVRSSTSLGQFQLRLIFKPNVAMDDAEKVISSYMTILKKFSIDCQTNYLIYAY